MVVPHINKSFFAEAIAGIEEVCSNNGYGLIICQSHESLEKECEAIETLVRQNVACIIISVSVETITGDHLQSARDNHIEIIQLDRYIKDFPAHKIINDNEKVSSEITRHLIKQGYKKIAFIGAPGDLAIFNLRKKGFLHTMEKNGFKIPESFIVEKSLSQESAKKTALILLKAKDRPDAFLTVSDHQALGVWEAAKLLSFNIPEELGIFGFANEDFTQIIEPALSSADQKSKKLGEEAALLYFENSRQRKNLAQPVQQFKEIIVKMKIIERLSSQRHLK